MREHYLILEQLRSASPVAMRSAAAHVDAELQIKRADLEPGEALALRERDTSLTIAPAMPVVLARPMSSPTEAGSSVDAGPWGIEAVGALTSRFTGRGVSVAVLDTGIDAAHAAFTHLGQKIEQRDFTSEGNGDCNGHGTHCAAIICGGTIEGRRIGIAPGVAKCLAGKVLDGDGVGTTEQLARGMLWAAEQAAQVIAMSLGMDFPGYVRRLTELGLPVELATARALIGYRLNLMLFERLAAYVRAQGPNSVVIAAAGNESRRNENASFRIPVGPPAVVEGIVSVGALGRGPAGLTVASFSNTGPTLCAPGVDVLSARAGGGLVAMSGTSMATPHVAGVAALWAEKTTRVDVAGYLRATLVGQAQRTPLAPGLASSDVGAGLVVAPQQ